MLRRVHPVGLFRGPGIRFRGFCDASREELLREHLISHWISGRGCRVQYRAPLCRRDGVTPSGRTWKRYQPGKENRSGSWTCYWLPELAALISITMGETVLFSVTGLDIAAARRFYHPDLADPWPVANRPLWSLFYRSAPWVTGSLAVTGAALLVAGTIRTESRRLRRRPCGTVLASCARCARARDRGPRPAGRVGDRLRHRVMRGDCSSFGWP